MHYFDWNDYIISVNIFENIEVEEEFEIKELLL